MALNIKDPTTDRLARELADLKGESITVAVGTALRTGSSASVEVFRARSESRR